MTNRVIGTGQRRGPGGEIAGSRPADGRAGFGIDLISLGPTPPKSDLRE